MSFSIIIPTRNAVNAKACVAAVANEGGEIIIVDDGLPIGAHHYLKPARIVRGKKPFCYSVNNNIGIREAGDNDVLLLNDDALLETPGGLKKLAKIATENPQFGAVAPACNNLGNPNQNRRIGNDGIREEPRTLCFTAVYIPHSTISKIGLLDEAYTNYGVEDDDYSLRIRNAGLKLGIYDGCYFSHDKLPSEYRGRGGGDFRENLKIFIKKWGTDNWGNSRENSPFPECWPT